MTDMLQIDPKFEIDPERRRPGRAPASAELIPLLRSKPNADAATGAEDWDLSTMDDPLAPARGIATGLAIMAVVWSVLGWVIYRSF